MDFSFPDIIKNLNLQMDTYSCMSDIKMFSFVIGINN